MTEQSSRPPADTVDQPQSQKSSHDTASALEGSVFSVPDAVAATQAGVSPETHAVQTGTPDTDSKPAGPAQTDTTQTDLDAADPDAKQEASTSVKKRVHPREVIAHLAAAWPSAFFLEPRSVKPLTIGVLQQILANRPAELEGLNSQAIRTGIKFYTSRLSYHYGMVHNTHRITLAGEPAEEVDEKAREFAKTQIVAIKQQREARQAAQNPPDNASQAQTMDESVAVKKPVSAKTNHKPRSAPKAEEKERGGHAGAPPSQRQRRLRQDQARPSRVDKPAACGTHAEPVTENLSMEEKLARLAQHFGKS